MDVKRSVGFWFWYRSPVDGSSTRTQAQRRERTRAALIAAARRCLPSWATPAQHVKHRRACRRYPRCDVPPLRVERGAVSRQSSRSSRSSSAMPSPKSAMASNDPIEQLRLGARAFLDAAGQARCVASCCSMRQRCCRWMCGDGSPSIRPRAGPRGIASRRRRRAARRRPGRRVGAGRDGGAARGGNCHCRRRLIPPGCTA